MNALNQCLDSGKHSPRVAANLKAEALGVASTLQPSTSMADRRWRAVVWSISKPSSTKNLRALVNLVVCAAMLSAVALAQARRTIHRRSPSLEWLLNPCASSGRSITSALSISRLT